MIRSNQAGQAKNRPPRREEGENGNLQRFPRIYTNPVSATRHSRTRAGIWLP
ncbi:hypothetical protein [Profundibacter sp.]|uniref:hypothetical protein n=1 Tax=Profundibacter sp. TaxID=3101071 RepID=UPI003D12478F